MQQGHDHASIESVFTLAEDDSFGFSHEELLDTEIEDDELEVVEDEIDEDEVAELEVDEVEVGGIETEVELEEVLEYKDVAEEEELEPVAVEVFPPDRVVA